MLGLLGTKLSDAGLAHLNGLTNLTFLRMDNTQTSDVGLAHLHDLKSLTTLIVRGDSRDC